MGTLFKAHGCILFALLISFTAQAQSPSWEDFLREGRHREAYNSAKTQLKGPKSEFYLGVLALQNGNNDEAIVHFTAALPNNRDLNDYIYFFRGQAHLGGGETQKALEDFKKAQSTTGLKFLADVSQFYEAEAYAGLKQWKKAEPLYQKTSKRLQRTKYHPAALWGYLLSQVKNNKTNKVCRQAKELYLKYPSYSDVADWGIYLNENTVHGKKLGCIVTFPEQKLRVQRMLWAGLEDKALSEIQSLQKKAVPQLKYSVDELMVSYLLNGGHIDEAQKILDGYSKDRSEDYDFQMLVGKVNSRSSQPQKGVEAYYKAYKLAKNSREASPALFQSGFLSYSIGDYAGATIKFKEYAEKFPTARSYADSRWYSAWLQYLQKDFVGAEKSFNEILEAKKSKPRLFTEHKEDKVTYWLAMSQLRQGKKDQAAEIFSELTHDDSVGYYSVAAFQRYSQITGRQLASNTKTAVHENWWLPEAVAGAVKKDHEEDNLVATEDPFVAKVDTMLDFEGKAEEALSDEIIIQRIPQNLGKDIQSVYFNRLERTMQRGLTLSRVGLDDFAYREVLDTEGNKLTNEQKTWLLNAHQSVNSYNRSVVLASYFYSDQVAKLGLIHGADYWTYSYPKAYEKVVSKYSKQMQTPAELIWSIMRAETIYRPDAISPVGARGLMQVMPRTSRKLASLSGDGAVEVEDLLQPPVSIKYGATYLQRLLKKFKGSIPLTAAAYNGGPHRVQAWMSFFGGLDMDEFVEHIPYQETRNYVKKVSKYYAIYNLLYNKKTNAMDILAKPIGFKIDGSVPTMETWERLDVEPAPGEG